MEKTKYKQQRGFYFFKKYIPKNFVNKKSKQHFNQVLLNKWDYVKGKDVLDAGCGHCEFLNLNPRNLNVVGMDIKKSDNFKVKEGDLNKKIPFKDNSFDTVTCFHVLEHLDNPKKALQEIKRVLRKDGLSVFAVPNHSFKHFYDDYTHKRLYTKTSLYYILRDNGFENIKIESGPGFNQIISLIFFFFPKLRFKVEKLFGKIFPYEFVAISQPKK